MALGGPPAQASEKAWPLRIAVALFMAVQVGYMAFFFINPIGMRQSTFTPTAVLSIIYVWHLLLLPVVSVIMITIFVAWGPFVLIRRITRRPYLKWPSEIEDDIAAATGRPTRRQVLGAAVAAVPPLIATGGGAYALLNLHDLRVRNIDVYLKQLPRQLDGVRIAHVSDVHVGRFTRPAHLPPIIHAVNRLEADLVLLTGDLIDLSLAALPDAMHMVRQLRPFDALAMCEGNHDLIENRAEFERIVKSSEIPLLLDETRTLRVRGVPVQLLGLRWARGDDGIDHSMHNLRPQRDPEAFQILLAHHPHAFDPAAEGGVPLTLAGHTHGGQLMLNERLGAGPIMFRYWSGLYRRRDSALVVSNGTGNWFPLRTHAPAEIIHLTLRRQT